MGRLIDWWLNRRVEASWRLPISNLQGVRPVGGFLAGTPTWIEFVPNRFEAMTGGIPWLVLVDDIEDVTLRRHRLRITARAGAGTGALATRTLLTTPVVTAARVPVDRRTLLTVRSRSLHRHLESVMTPVRP